MDYGMEVRCKQITKYVIGHQSTVRQAAIYFKVSKSTVYQDITKRIAEVDPVLANCVKPVLAKNKAERHIRGALATKHKFEMLRNQNN